MNTQRKLIAALSLCAAVTIPNIATAVSVSGQGTWESTLQGRDLDGVLTTAEAYYDTVLGITWLADANYAMTSGYDNAVADGSMTWANAMTWATSLNVNGYIGWRLPITNPIDGTTADDANNSYIGSEDRGYNVSAPGTLYAGSTASEMAHLFYNTLGNKGYCNPATSTVSSCSGPQTGWGLTNTGPFSDNVQSVNYWSATEYAPNTGSAWRFHITHGLQYNYIKSINFSAWAVHAGDVGIALPTSAVPVPAAAWLFGSGLIGMFGLVKKGRNTND